MEEELDRLQLIVEVFDDLGNFEGEWPYEVTRSSITEWEEIDALDFEQGKTLVRYLLLSKLKEHSPLTWTLLTNNTCLNEFLYEGVPSNIVSEIPRLSVVNAAVERMYDCLSRLVLEENIRIAH